MRRMGGCSWRTPARSWATLRLPRTPFIRCSSACCAAIWWNYAGFAAASAAIVTLAAVIGPAAPSHEVHTTGDSGSEFVLADGSRVELHADSSLSLDRDADGVGIRLARGSILVHAAKQRRGHLYVIAKPPARANEAAVEIMLRSLLAQRFGLVAREDTRPMPACVLSKGRLDPGLKPPGTSEEPRCRVAQFAQQLNHMMGVVGSGRRVVDETGLQGSWGFTLSYRVGPQPISEPGVAPDPVPDQRLPLGAALERQLGLRFDQATRPMPVLVIDHVEENPTEN